jgi:hypothetical protein
MKKSMFLASILLIMTACGKDKDSQEAPQVASPLPTPVAIPLLEGISEKSLWDYSTEKRCDGIKEFLSGFAKQRLGGAVTNFNCFEAPVAKESYAASAEVTFDNQSVLFSISAYREGGRATPCIGEYNSDPIYLKCVSDLPSTTDKKVLAARNDLPVLFKTFVATSQTKNLVYDLAPDEFNKLAVDRLSAAQGVKVPFKGVDYQFFLKLTPSSQDITKGQLVIEQLVPATGYQIFGCNDAECLKSKVFSYEIHQHWFVFYGDKKMSVFIIPNPK